jgi:hypothetical protein
MSEIVIPYIRVSREKALPDSASAPREFGVFCAKVIPPLPSELPSLHWSWNLRDYVLDTHPDRSQQWFSGLHGEMAPKEYQERSVSMRLLHEGADRPLKFRLLIRVDSGNNPALEISKQTWYEVFSTFPFDYDLKAIGSEQEMLDETGQNWLEDSKLQVAAEVLQPSIGIINGLSAPDSYPIPTFGKWKATPTSSENVWRTLHNYPFPIIMDVLLRAIVLRNDEIMALDLLIKELQELSSKEIRPVFKIQAQQWLDSLIQRAKNLAPLFLVQVRLASPQKIYPYLSRIIGTALTYQSISDPIEPFQGYRVEKPDPKIVPDWIRKIVSLDFIDIPLPVQVHPSLQRIPLTASVMDLPYITRFPLIPRARIPNLLLEAS